MLFIAAGILAGIVFVVRDIGLDFPDPKDSIFIKFRTLVSSVLLLALFTLACGAIGGSIALTVDLFLPKEYVMAKEIELAGTGEQGNVFLNVSANGAYYFFHEKGNGANLDKIFFRKTTVYEEERENGVIKVYRSRFLSERHKIIALQLYPNKYEAFIPKGGIRYR